jgi:glycerol uptake facilitator-like aquaporin
MGNTIGPLSGGAFNPAVALLAFSDASTWSGLLGAYNWVYAAGPLLGALIAALTNRLIMIDEYVPPLDLEPRALV